MQLFLKGILPTILRGCHHIVAVQCHCLDFATISPTSDGQNAKKKKKKSARKSQSHPKSAKMLANPEYANKKCEHFWAGATHWLLIGVFFASGIHPVQREQGLGRHCS